MSSPSIYPTFYFYPQALREASKRIQEKYKHSDQISEHLTAIKLPKLLQQIRELRDNTPEIIAFAKKLKTIDINVLATEFPYEAETNTTVKKIMLILIERYNRIVGRRFWSHFQVQPYDDQIKEMLTYAFEAENGNYLALKAVIRNKYKHIFSPSSNVIEQLSYEIGTEKRALSESLSDWKVKNESTLSNILWLRIMEIFIQEPWFIKVQGVEAIELKLENLSSGIYKKILNTYLKAFEFQKYYSELLKQAIQRLGDPRHSLQGWKNISDEAIEKVKKWLYKNELFEFLDYDRFAYWEKYIRNVTDLIVVQDPPVAAMYFNDFVVLEFANIGNAAYFYESEGFSKHMATRLTSYVQESNLKNRDAHYFIHRLSHSRNWHTRFDEYMYNYLNGHFGFRI